MSSKKRVTNVILKMTEVPNIGTKFASQSAAEGTRALPANIPKKNHEWQVRVDFGKLDTVTGLRKLNTQVNTEATIPSLKRYIQENSSHAKLAEETFDTKAKDLNAEAKRALRSMAEQAVENLKNMTDPDSSEAAGKFFEAYLET